MIEYENNCMKVLENLSSAVSQYLTEAGGEIQGQTIRNSRTDTGQTKGSYKYKVVEESNAGTVFIGSDLENAIWEEFGTGEYALLGNGRKTPWVYKDRKGKYHRTKGKTPNKPLHNAFVSKKEVLKCRLAEVVKSNL